MNRIAFPVSMLAPACRTPRTPTLGQGITLQSATLPSITPIHTRPYTSGGGTTSAPKSAEKPSATSGGSRSKEAVETGSSPTAGVMPDPLADGDARGRTGGGAPLESSQHAPAPPKVDNAKIPGGNVKLSKEQQAEVDEHNRDFEAKHGLANPAGDDKVDKSFWSGRGSMEVNK